MDPLTPRVVQRHLQSFKYQPKETKQHKVERLTKVVRDATGLSKSRAEEIVDAAIRGRDVQGLALQKGWAIKDGVIEGPSGTIALSELK